MRGLAERRGIGTVWGAGAERITCRGQARGLKDTAQSYPTPGRVRLKFSMTGGAAARSLRKPSDRG